MCWWHRWIYTEGHTRRCAKCGRKQHWQGNITGLDGWTDD